MWAIILILVGLCGYVVMRLCGYTVVQIYSRLCRGWIYPSDASDAPQERKSTSAACATCSGSSAKCEQECMMEAATQPIEYFDDEELDRFRGKESSDYTEEESCEFAEVLHTMRQSEVKDWCRSLTLRGINLPNQLKDEVFMLVE